MTAPTPVAPKPTGEGAPTYENRRAKISVGRHLLHAMFDVPEGFRIVGVHSDADHQAVQVVVESDSLPDQPAHCELPYVAGSWTTYGYEVDGKVYQRFGWEQVVR